MSLKDESSQSIDYMVDVEVIEFDKFKGAVNRFNYILSQVAEKGDFSNYQGSKNDLVKDIMDITKDKFKEIFGEFKE